ncbi:KH domain-containing protein, partial [Patescibacteria group bacterium]|nr:KH domain-containing protein [Patescibacteria group bacterium]
MSHKVHPKIFRVRETKDWTSRWFGKKDYAELLKEDFIIREFLEEKLKDMGLEIIEIERFPGKVNIVINSSRPGLIIGRGGSGIEQLRKELVKVLLKERIATKTRSNQQNPSKAVSMPDRNTTEKEIRLEIREIKNPW